MKRQCFICRKLVNDGSPRPAGLPADYGQDGKYSHCICESCRPAYEKQVDAEIAKLKGISTEGLKI
jgi:hypothetical protein